MSLVKTYGCAVYGISATTVTVEVNIDTGINFHIVGLPDSAVKESQQRIDAALKTTGIKFQVKNYCEPSTSRYSQGRVFLRFAYCDGNFMCFFAIGYH